MILATLGKLYGFWIMQTSKSYLTFAPSNSIYFNNQMNSVLFAASVVYALILIIIFFSGTGFSKMKSFWRRGRVSK